MIVVFLGTSAGKPSLDRNVTSLWLNLQEEIGENWLIDCGEGTQQQMMHYSFQQKYKKERINPLNLDRIFITHLHGDHVLGLFGVLIARSMAGQVKPLHLIAPKGIKQMVESILGATQSKLSYPLNIQELDEMQQGDLPLTILEQSNIKVKTLSLKHRLSCFGYRIELSAPNRSIVIFGDSMPCENVVTLGHQADCIIFEATYMHDLADLAVKRMHSTTKQAAELARLAQCKQLIVTHLSGRYCGELLTQFQQEVSSIFPENQIAFDFKRFEF